MNKNLDEFEQSVQNERIKTMENEIEFLANELGEMKKVIEMQTKAIKDTQQFAIKIGVAQNRITERVLKWPYVEVQGDSEK